MAKATEQDTKLLSTVEHATKMLCLFQMKQIQQDLIKTTDTISIEKVADIVFSIKDQTRTYKLSKLYTTFFKEMASQIENFLPNGFFYFLQTISDPYKQIHVATILQKNVLTVVHKPSLKNFLQGYSTQLGQYPPGSSTYNLIMYIRNKKFHQHLEQASPRDLTDILLSFQKSVWHCLLKIKVSENDMISTNCLSFFEKILGKYEWVKNLSSIQQKIKNVIASPDLMSQKNLAEIGIKVSSKDVSFLQENCLQACNILRYYGIVDCHRENNIITIRCANLSLSDTLKLVTVANDLEIHFVTTQCFYIDTSKCLYPGFNIAVCSPKVYTKCKSIIDVSGIHASQIVDRKAQNGATLVPGKYESGKSGHHGVHGQKGQSGGNILIQTDQIINPEWLTLKSCGGNGTDGQDGGDGSDGVAEQSKKDDLQEWPKDIACFFSKKKCKEAHIKIEEKMKKQQNFKEVSQSNSLHYRDKVSMFCKTPEGVKILYGFTDGAFKRKGFILSKSKDGISADGGDAGIGGSGGGGGKAGDIIVKNMNGTMSLLSEYSHWLTLESTDGKDGKPGKTGKNGKQDIARRVSDHLFVDEWSVFGKRERYPTSSNGNLDPTVIIIQDWKKSTKTGELGKNCYYCDHTLVQNLDSSIHVNEIGFFVAKPNTSTCLTKNNCIASDGSSQEQCVQISQSTKKRNINTNLLMQSHITQLENQSTLLNIGSRKINILDQLYKLQTGLYLEIQKQNALVFQKSKSKLSNFSLGPSTDISQDMDVRPIVIRSSSTQDRDLLLPELKHELTSICHSKYCSDETIEPFLNMVQDSQTTWQQVFTEAVDVTHNAIERHKNSEIIVLPILEDIFLKIIHSSQFLIEGEDIIRELVKLVIDIEKIVCKEVTIKIISHTKLISKYKIFILEKVHEVFLTVYEHLDLIYQAKVATVIREIRKIQISSDARTKSLLDLHNCFTQVNNKSKIKNSLSFRGDIQSYNCSCTEAVQTCFTEKTQNLLIKLIIHFNEFYERKNRILVFLPNLLESIELELEAYGQTICESDLLFLIKYFQHKLFHLMSRDKLEQVICTSLKDFLSTESNILQNKFVFDPKVEIMYHMTCEIKNIKNVKKFFMKATKSFANKKELTFTSTGLFEIDGEKISLLRSKSILVSIVNFAELWNDIRTKIIDQGIFPSENSITKKVHLWKELDKNQRQKLLSLLKRSYDAQFIPYDVFSFQRPTKWIEQLFLYTIKIKYTGVIDSATDLEEFLFAIKNSISGLSDCLDKTFYHIFFNKFLMSTSDNLHKNECLKILRDMREIFIFNKVCTLVTQEGIAQVVGEEESQDIDILIQEKIISHGCFTAVTTLETIEKAYNDNPKLQAYLANQFKLQCICHSLTDKEFTFWSHTIYELKVRLELSKLVNVPLGDDTFSELFLYYNMLEQHYGQTIARELISSLKQIDDKIEIGDLKTLFQMCARKEWLFGVVLNKFKKATKSTFKSTMKQLKETNWEEHFSKTTTPTEIIESIKPFFPDENIKKNLDKIPQQLNSIQDIEKKQSCLINISSLICNFSAQEIKQWASEFKKRKEKKEIFLEAIAVLRRAITLFFETNRKKSEIVPRDTQMIACLLFFTKLDVQEGATQGTRLMQQIATGEGKTMIISMIAILKVLSGEKVDIVTSSSVLAIRDAEAYKELYGLFSITVSHCCHQEVNRRQQAYEADIIYGDIGSFQRDILETNFYDKSIRTGHNYDNVIVDEVDSMLVDKGQTMLYLPHEIPDMSSLESIYLVIWTFANSDDIPLTTLLDNQSRLIQEQRIHEDLKLEIFGGIPVNAFACIPDITEEISKKIHQECCHVNLIDKEFYVPTTCDFVEIETLIGKISVIPKYLQQEVLLIFQESIALDPIINIVPKELHPFVRKSFKTWIKSALFARCLQPNIQYIIDIDRSESAPDRYPKIIIMDNETGVEQESSQWNNGLHQFLQLKHHLRLDTESLKAVYMSNISFFTRYYTNVMGVTGTIGSTDEYNLFHRLYGSTKVIKFPTYRHSRLQIEVPTFCVSQQEWKQAIDSDVTDKISSGRSVLLICADVRSAKELYKYFSNKKFSCDTDIKLYISSHQQKLEEVGEFESGQIIIATNLAGRGTDIAIGDSVKKNGGLHVCLTYLPPNVRVEQQAYGRAARNGDKGSCKMIFHSREQSMGYAIQKRNLIEAHRVADIEADYLYNIKLQEELFKKFAVEYKSVKTTFVDRANLDYCLDSWAFFLDEHTETIESIPSMQTHQERVEANKKIDKLFSTELLKKFSGKKKLDLSSKRSIQLGHYYMTEVTKIQTSKLKVIQKCKQKLEEIKKELHPPLQKAKDAYQAALELSPKDPFVMYYHENAKINLIFCKFLAYTTSEEDCKKYKQALYKLIPLFKQKIDTCMAHITALYMANRHHDLSLTSGTAFYEEQKQHEMDIYNAFIGSIHNIIGHEFTYETCIHVHLNEFESAGIGTAFEIIKRELKFKGDRISKLHWLDRFDHLFQTTTTYKTFQMKIKRKIQSLLENKEVISEDDINQILPNKRDFWELLCREGVITDVKDDVGYWNPDKVPEEIPWEAITEESFDWILNLPDPNELLQHLKKNKILYEDGQLCETNFSTPYNLPAKYTPYYKQIKDTLKDHCQYYFVYKQLFIQKCVISDNILEDSSLNEEQSSKQFCTNTTEASITLADVPSIMESMNSGLNVQPHQLVSQLKPTDHHPTEEMNKRFNNLLSEKELQATEVSGYGLNCLINALIQHAKTEYTIAQFEEAENIRELLVQKFPSEARMLHLSGPTGLELLKLVNDECSTTEKKIGKVTEVLASAGDPFILPVAKDDRYPNGRHVIIWQQGNHFVAIVPKNQCGVSSRFVSPQKVPPQTISTEQFDILKRLNLITRCNDQSLHLKYRICSSLAYSRRSLSESTDIMEEDKISCIKFLENKLILTLNEYPISNQHHLYKDLCLYSVIKKDKLKKESGIETIKTLLHWPIDHLITEQGRKIAAQKFAKYNWNLKYINTFFRFKEFQEINDESLKNLEKLLMKHSLTSIHKKKNCREILKEIISDVQFLSQQQKEGFVDYIMFSISFTKCKKDILSKVKNNRSALLDVTTPVVNLVCLTDHLKDIIHGKEDVFFQFRNNQCNFIAQIGEKKWSARSVALSLSIIAAGVGQLAIGVATTVTGVVPLVGMIGISEGVSDIVHGFECLVKGQCTFKGYLKHKVVSLAFTAAFVGTSAFTIGYKSAITKGTQKAIKSGFTAIKDVLFASKSIEPSTELIIKMITRSLKNGIGKTVEVALDTGVNFFLNKFSESMDTLSSNMLENFENSESKEKLQKTMEVFINKHPNNSKEKLRHITLEMIEKYQWYEILYSFDETIIVGGACTAVEKLAKHVKLGSEAIELLKIFVRTIPIISNLFKTGLAKKQVAQTIKDWEATLASCNDTASSEEVHEQESVKLSKEEVKAQVQNELEFAKKKFHSQMKTRVTSVIKTSKEALKANFSAAVDRHINESFEEKLGNAVFGKSSEQTFDSVSDIQRECNQNMSKLHLRTRNPEIFADMIETQSVPMDEEFLIPALESQIKKEIIIQQPGESVVPQTQSSLIVTRDENRCYFVENVKFDPKKYGNDCLAIAVLGKDRIPGFKSHLATLCKTKDHPCNEYIRYGLAQKF